MRPFTLLGSLVLLAIALVSCGDVQSFQSTSNPSLVGTNWRAISPEGIDPISLAISPDFSNDSTLFMGLDGWDMGVFRSTDGGDSWQEVYEGLRGSAHGGWVVLSPNFASDRTVFAGRGNGGVVRSTDSGDSWKKANSGLPRYQDVGSCCGYYGVTGLVFSPSFASDSTVFLATWNGLYRSTNGGKTWQNMSQDLAETWVVQVLLSPSFGTDNTVFVLAEAPGGNALYKSTDRGETWRQLTELQAGFRGLAVPGEADSPIPNLRVDRWYSVPSGIVISPDFGTDGTLFAVTPGIPPLAEDGLLRSTDQGNTWETVYTSDRGRQGWVVLSPNFGTDSTLFTSKVCESVFRSQDRGETWEEVTSELLFPLIGLVPGHHTCDPPGFRTIVFPPSSTTDSTLFVWTEVGIFQLSNFRISP